MFLAFTFAFSRLKESPFNLPRQHRWTLAFRGFFGVISNMLSITAIKLIALTKSQVIYWTIPIFTAVFANKFLGERITQYDWAAVFLAFSGIILITNPFGAAKMDEDPFIENVGVICSLLGAVTGGMAFTAVKKMGKEVHYLMSPWSWCIANFILAPIFTVVQRVSLMPHQFHVYNGYDVILILGISVFMVLNMTFATLAYQNEKAGRVSPIAYSQIFIVAILDVVIFGTSLSWNQWLGGAIIVFSNLSISMLKCFEIIK
ncbi:hypothetical protein FGO68_gene12186 [Halteria grandinella]|uniref:EamA domain-containing protein n=1 Tax=Halteria grandinella TaxID=5974 RepID=A0A8J8NJI7_HALGN|nr:hypothetical protein FGO68_gene12186 [Halteria grandinella]